MSAIDDAYLKICDDAYLEICVCIDTIHMQNKTGYVAKFIASFHVRSFVRYSTLGVHDAEKSSATFHSKPQDRQLSWFSTSLKLLWLMAV